MYSACRRVGGSLRTPQTPYHHHCRSLGFRFLRSRSSAALATDDAAPEQKAAAREAGEQEEGEEEEQGAEGPRDLQLELVASFRCGRRLACGRAGRHTMFCFLCTATVTHKAANGGTPASCRPPAATAAAAGTPCPRR